MFFTLQSFLILRVAAVKTRVEPILAFLALLGIHVGLHR
jgi:hypothetical protein